MSKQSRLDYHKKNAEAYDSGKQTPRGKGKQPTKVGLSDPHANCTPESGCEVALERDMSAPERRRKAQVALDLALQAYVKAATEEGLDYDRVQSTVSGLLQDAYHLQETT